MKSPTLFSLVVCLAIVDPSSTSALERTQSIGQAKLTIASPSKQAELPLVELLTITLSIQGEVLEVEPMEFPSSPWMLIRQTAPKQSAEGWHQIFVIAPQTPGKLQLELAPLRYRNREQNWHSATWQPIDITVTTTIQSADRSKLRDITSIETLSPPDEASFTWYWLLLLLIPGCVYFYLRRKTGTSLDRKSSPSALAQRRLRRLSSSHLLAQGQHHRFVTLLMHIIRRYLESGLQIPTRGRTSAEFLLLANASPGLSPQQRVTLSLLCEHGDRIQFSGSATDTETCEKLMDQARNFLDETTNS